MAREFHLPQDLQPADPALVLLAPSFGNMRRLKLEIRVAARAWEVRNGFLPYDGGFRADIRIGHRIALAKKRAAMKHGACATNGHKEGVTSDV